MHARTRQRQTTRGLVACLLPVLLLACGRPAPERLPAPSNILLVTVDTLRADHLSSYGYGRQTSPVLDRLAAEGVRFAEASVQWPKTGPSFASIFTATYPKDNGVVRKIGDWLPWELRMLAEELAERGYATRAVVANGALGREFNFDQGFEKYVETWKLPTAPAGGDANRAEVVTDHALELAEGLDPARPYFLWVHYLDPHFPYRPPSPWSDRFQGDALWHATPRVAVNRDRERIEMGGIGRNQLLDDREELAFYVARYDAEIAYTDAEIGRLLEGLRQQGLLERTLTVVTSDHGESLGDHAYYFDHGRFGFQSCLHVPLIFHYPGVLEPRVDRDPVELLGVAPTLLEAAGEQLERGRWMQGRSLVPRLLGRETAVGPRYAFSEAGYATRYRWQKIARDRRFKLYFAPYRPDQRWIGGSGTEYVLYDLEEDPGETRNVRAEHPEEFDRLKEALYAWYQIGEVDVRIDAPGPREAPEMDEKTRRQLKALGYIQ